VTGIHYFSLLHCTVGNALCCGIGERIKRNFKSHFSISEVVENTIRMYDYGFETHTPIYGNIMPLTDVQKFVIFYKDKLYESVNNYIRKL